MNKPSTIKNDPFAAVIPVPDEPLEEMPTVEVIKPPANRPDLAESKRADTMVAPEATNSAHRRARLSMHLEPSLANRVKNAAYWNPRLTVAGMAEKGIRLVIAQIEKEHGGPYPQRESDLKGGRQVK